MRARFTKSSFRPAFDGRIGRTLESLNIGVAAALSLGLLYSLFVLWTGTSSPFLVVQGSSMEPTYHEGDLLLSRRVPVSAIRPGDVIAFKTPEDVQESLGIPVNVAHRVIDVRANGGQLVFVTQGDNSDVDPFIVLAEDVHSVIIQNLGPLARPVLILRNRGLMVTLALPFIVFVVLVMFSLRSSQDTKAPTEMTDKADEITDRSAAEIRRALKGLTEAVTEYGVHLKSHTAVMVNLAETTRDLKEVTKLNNEVLRGPGATPHLSLHGTDEKIIIESEIPIRDELADQLALAHQPSGREKAPGQRRARK